MTPETAEEIGARIAERIATALVTLGWTAARRSASIVEVTAGYVATAIKEAEARGLERAANLIEDSWPFEKRLSDLIAEIRSLKPSPENPKG